MYCLACKMHSSSSREVQHIACEILFKNTLFCPKSPSFVPHKISSTSHYFKYSCYATLLMIMCAHEQSNLRLLKGSNVLLPQLIHCGLGYGLSQLRERWSQLTQWTENYQLTYSHGNYQV